MAARFPRVSVRTATAAIIGSHTSRADCSANGPCPAKIRSRNAIDAALEATERYAVTVVGAPSYASGAHIWKGAAETLKSKPTDVVARARKVSGSEAPRCPT